MNAINGIWLPIITPFKDNEIDTESYTQLIRHYMETGIDGFIPLGTTGECPTVSEEEFEQILDLTMELVAGRLPVIVGAGANDTSKAMKMIRTAEKYNPDGILSVCPYYNRPGQEGLYAHFMKLAEATDLPTVIYNIPYRTGVNMTNDTLLRLAGQPNIVGVKDSCGDIRQTLDLLASKPIDFSVLTGDDLLLFTNLANGGDGGILASAHLQTDQFVAVYDLMQANDHHGALKIWQNLADFIPLLFAESNPAPLKYCLEQTGLIAASEVRLPLMPVSEILRKELDERFVTRADRGQ